MGSVCTEELEEPYSGEEGASEEGSFLDTGQPHPKGFRI